MKPDEPATPVLRRLLLIEDDQRLAAVVKEQLGGEGFIVDAVHDGVAGLAALLQHAHDIAVVDGMLPGKDGIDVIREAHAAGVSTPLLLLTARDSVADRVVGLDAGADDYLGKPFALEELLARLRALLRRRGGEPVLSRLTWGLLTLDIDRHEVLRGSEVVALSARQFSLLEALLRLRGNVASRSMLLERVFGYSFDPGTNIVDVHVRQLRQRLDAPGAPSTIETVRGVGYRMASPTAAETEPGAPNAGGKARAEQVGDAGYPKRK